MFCSTKDSTVHAVVVGPSIAADAAVALAAEQTKNKRLGDLLAAQSETGATS